MNVFERFFSIGVLVVAWCQAAYADGEYCDDDGGAYVCVRWSQQDDPDPNTDFVFNFTDSDNPDVTLKVGDSDWRVWSQVSDVDTDPANLGNVTLDASDPDYDFTVTIINEDVSGPGAADLGSAILYDATNWAGHSNLVNLSEISGDLTGDLEVVDDSGGNGGELVLTVEGDVASGSKVVAHTLYLLHVEGDMDGDVQTDVIDSDGGGGLFIDGDLSGDVNVIDQLDGNIGIEGNVFSTASITIDDFLTGTIQTNGSRSANYIIASGWLGFGR